MSARSTRRLDQAPEHHETPGSDGGPPQAPRPNQPSAPVREVHFDRSRRNAGMRLAFPLIPAAAIAAAGIYWYAPIEADTPRPIVTRAVIGDFTAKLTEAGELRALDSATVSAPDDELVIFLVTEGAHVKKGDVLVRFDSAKHDVAIEDARAALAVAEADMQKARTDLEAQRHKLLAEIARYEAEVRLAELDLAELKKRPLPDELERARMDLEKARFTLQKASKKRDVFPELVARGFITAETLEDAEVAFLEAKASLQVAQFNHDKVAAGATPHELALANIRLEQARFALEKARQGMESQLQSFQAAIVRENANVGRSEKLIDKAEVKLRSTELRAPRDGLVVYARAGGESSLAKVQPGMIPFEGQPLIYLPDLSTMVVDTVVNEVDIGKVKEGGPVEVRLEGFPGAVFHGSVMKIGSLAKLKQSPTGDVTGIKAFDVTVLIEEKDPRLKPGLTATIDIIVDHRVDVVSIPLSAVDFRNGEGTVFVADGQMIAERKVDLGPSNEQHVVVEDGLRPGEQILLTPSLPVRQ